MALDGIARQPACLRSSSDTASGECRWKTRAKTHNHAFTCWYADTHQLYYLLGFGFLSDVEDPAMCPEHESDHCDLDQKGCTFPFLTLSRELSLSTRCGLEGLGWPKLHLPFIGAH